VTPRNEIIHILAMLPQDSFDDLVLEAESARLRQHQEALVELQQQEDEEEQEEEEMDPYANIRTDTLAELLERANGIAGGHYFETEFTLMVKISGSVVAEFGEGVVSPEDLTIEVESRTNLPSCVIDSVTEALSELILDDCESLEETADAVAGMTEDCGCLVEEVTDLEVEHNLPEAGLLTQLIEKSDASLA